MKVKAEIVRGTLFALCSNVNAINMGPCPIVLFAPWSCGGCPCRFTNVVQTGGLCPEEVKMMGDVFEDVLKTLGPVDRKDRGTEVIAHRVIELVQSGERRSCPLEATNP